MAVKVLIRHRISQEQIETVLPLIQQIRTLAQTYAGYIYGETLRCADNPEEYLVISSWQSLGHWHCWQANVQRRRLLDKIRSCQDGAFQDCKVYHHEFLLAPLGELTKAEMATTG